MGIFARFTLVGKRLAIARNRPHISAGWRLARVSLPHTETLLLSLHYTRFYFKIMQRAMVNRGCTIRVTFTVRLELKLRGLSAEISS